MSSTKEDVETRELLEGVAVLLDQLCPERFVNIVDQFRQMNIDTVERMECVVELVFQKAIKHPKFASPCAVIYKMLATVQKADPQNGAEKAEKFQESVTARSYKELVKFAEYDTKSPNRNERFSLKYILIFIGVLFNEQLFPDNFLMRLLDSMLSAKITKCLEYVTILLLIIREELETSNNIDTTCLYRKIEKLSEADEEHITDRIKSKLGVLVKLHKNWVIKTKEKSQIQLETSVMMNTCSYQARF